MCSLSDAALVMVRWVFGWRWGCVLSALFLFFWQLCCFANPMSASQQSTLCISIPWAGFFFFFKELTLVLAMFDFRPGMNGFENPTLNVHGCPLLHGCQIFFLLYPKAKVYSKQNSKDHIALIKIAYKVQPISRSLIWMGYCISSMFATRDLWASPLWCIYNSLSVWFNSHRC